MNPSLKPILDFLETILSPEGRPLHSPHHLESANLANNELQIIFKTFSTEQHLWDTCLNSTKTLLHHQFPTLQRINLHCITTKPKTSILLVAGGKGGIGKSTISLNIAVALAHQGLRILLCDADIYGPSQNHLQNISSSESLDIIEKYNILSLSAASVLKPNKAVALRSPMILKILHTLVQTALSALPDIIVIDCPPGTGDTLLSLLKMLPHAQALLVTTPQDTAWIDITRTLDLFTITQTPMLGYIRNMSSFLCPCCEKSYPIYPPGALEKNMETLHCPKLADIPLSLDISSSCEEGIPFVYNKPSSPIARIFLNLAATIHKRLATSAQPGSHLEPPPSISS